MVSLSLGIQGKYSHSTSILQQLCANVNSTLRMINIGKMSVTVDILTLTPWVIQHKLVLTYLRNLRQV
jgi:hypothetical protein